MLWHALQHIATGLQELKITFFGCLGNEGCYPVFVADQVMFGYQAAKTLHFIGQHRVGQHGIHVLFADKDDSGWFYRRYVVNAGFAG